MLIIAVAFIMFAVNHPEMSFPWNNTITWLLYGLYVLVTVVLLIAPKRWRSKQFQFAVLVPSRVWGRHAPTRALRKLTRVWEVKSRMGRKFSKIENLWPRDDSCSYLICSNSIFCDCFQIVKAHKQQRNFFLLKWWCSPWAPPLFYFIFEAQNHYFHSFEQWQRFKIILQTDVKYGI